MRFGEWLQNLDRRLIYAVMILVIAAPLVKPLGFPVKVTRETRAAFETIDAVPAGSKVLLATSIFPSTQAELEPQTVALVRHLVNKGIKIVFASCHPETPPYVERYASICKDLGYEEGVDFVVLPFMAGEETVYAAMGDNLKGLYTQVPSSELWDSIEDISSFEIFITAGGGEQPRMGIAHVGGPRGVKVVSLITAVVLASVQQYYSSGQLSGLISGLNGAAEYEALAQVPGAGTAGMDAQSLGHLWIILLVVLGNIGYLASGGSKQKKGGI